MRLHSPSPHLARRSLLHKLLNFMRRFVRPSKKVLPRPVHQWEKSQRSTKCMRMYLHSVQNPIRQTHPILSSIWLPRQPFPCRLARPTVLPASPISVASTPSHVGNGGSALEFSQLPFGSHATSPPQVFTTMHWKPKEPPCFFRYSTEDVHTWTSLVRHYLTFMGGSDAQQVAYSVTLLPESAHEWYIGYERRHRHPPRDWAQLCDLLLDRFGSNI